MSHKTLYVVDDRDMIPIALIWIYGLLAMYSDIKRELKQKRRRS